MINSWNKDYTLFIVTGISAISAFLLLLLMIGFSFFSVRTIEENVFVGLTLPAIISLYLFPKLCQKILMPANREFWVDIDKKGKAFLYLSLFIIFYNLAYSKKYESTSIMFMMIFHYIVVSVGEEFTYRKLILKLLNERYKTNIAVVISAFLFSFLLHINESLLGNLLIRFPIGIVLGFIAVKTESIAYTIILHTMYNLIVLIL